MGLTRPSARRVSGFVGLALCASLIARAALSSAAEPNDGLTRAEEHLRANRPTEAIAELEGLADLGHVDPAISFDRGLAYALRVQKGPATEGDLGRAVLGFEEAKALSSNEKTRSESEAALTSLRSEAAKRRSRGGEPPDVEEGLSLGRSVVHLLPEMVWFFTAIAFSIAFTAGLVLRRRALLRGEASQLGVLLGVASLPLCLVTTACGLGARGERLDLREGIVLRTGVRPFDDRHIVKTGVDTLPEGAKVRILGLEDGYVRFRRGAVEGTLPRDAVGEIARGH
jgi:hypothetical protein